MSDNRILGTSIMREYSYDGATGTATIYTGDDTIVVQIPLAIAQKIVDVFRRRYREGFKEGLAAARREIQALERST